ncbi:MAG: hypothetical protein QOF68_205 [Gaiellales bacterium]|nr:hypothetical protein [Gaiellales bacterium]
MRIALGSRAWPLAVLVAGAVGCSGASPSTLALPSPAQALAVAPDFSATLWAATGDQAWRSRDGGHSWHAVPGAGDAVGLAFGETGVGVVGPRGVQFGGYGGARLAPPRMTPVSFTAIATPYHRTDRFYGLDGFARLWLSVDAGRHWARLRAEGLPSTAIGISAVRDEVIDPDIVYVAAGTDGLWRSLDDGATFRRVDGVADARAVAMTTDDQDRMLVAGDRLYLSVDRGKTFRVVFPGAVDAVAFDPRNHRLAFAAMGAKLLRSIDGGVSWPEG